MPQDKCTNLRSIFKFSSVSSFVINDERFVLPQNFLYLIWYTTMSIFGHFNNFFFAAHLLDIAMGFKTLRTILSSVTHNGKQVSGSTSRGSQSTDKRMNSWSQHCVAEQFSFLQSSRQTRKPKH